VDEPNPLYPVIQFGAPDYYDLHASGCSLQDVEYYEKYGYTDSEGNSNGLPLCGAAIQQFGVDDYENYTRLFPDSPYVQDGNCTNYCVANKHRKTFLSSNKIGEQEFLFPAGVGPIYFGLYTKFDPNLTTFEFPFTIANRTTSDVVFSKTVLQRLDGTTLTYYNGTIFIVQVPNLSPFENQTLVNFRFASAAYSLQIETIRLTGLDIVGAIFGFVGFLLTLLHIINMFCLAPLVPPHNLRGVWDYFVPTSRKSSPQKSKVSSPQL